MKTRRIQWVGMAMLAGTAISVSAVSCEDPSIWSVQTMVGLIPAECITDLKCDDGNVCTKDTCNAAGRCEHLTLPATPECTDNNICTDDFCNQVTGLCDHEFDTTNVGPSSASCWQTTCLGGGEKETVAPDGYECEGPAIPSGTGYCYQSVCVSCADGKKNGDETDIDCGGFQCPRCDDALNCNNSNDCLHGHCVQGLCCNNECSDVCYSCNLPGSAGTCAAVPFEEPDYNPDPEPKCTFPYLCDGTGDCKANVNQPCTDANECLSGFCYEVTGKCQIDVGHDCKNDKLNCYTDYCEGGMCSFVPIDKSCKFHDQCGPDRVCYAQIMGSVCKIADFAVCDINMPMQCATGFCDPNQKCAKAPDGYMCKNNDQCASNKCTAGSCAAP